MTSTSDSTKGVHRRPRAWNVSVGLVVALMVVVVALGLPLSKDQSGSGGPTGPAAGAADQSDAEQLVDVWPGAVVRTLSASLPGGALYAPLLFLDADTSVGVTTTSDARTIELVVMHSDGAVRTLRTLTGPRRPTIAATAATADQIYWIEASEDDGGRRRAEIWHAPTRSGEARRLATDFSEVLFYDSVYDLQVSGDRLYWAAFGVGATDGSEIHSVPVAGGRIQARRLDDVYALTAWPWATTGAAGEPGDLELINLESGQRRTVPADANEILTCTPTWCRVTTLVNRGQSITVDLQRADGSERRRVGGQALMPLNPDVALVDRFEVLAGPSPGGSPATQRLWLHDLSTRRSAMLADSVMATIGSRGGYLWWSTGDNEVMVWQVLDLRQLR